MHFITAPFRTAWGPCKSFATLSTAGLLCAALVAGCSDEQTADQPDEALPVSAHRVQSETLPLVLEAVGRTEGSKDVELRARVGGILEKQLYNEGASVKAGTPLFLIDPVPYEIALARAEATLAQRRADRQQAKRNADRLGSLAAQNAVSRRQADDAISALEAADAAVLAAQAEVRDAQVNMSYTRVVAPISGVTGRAEHSEGSLITANSESGLLTRLTQTDPIWVRFALSINEYDALRAAGARDPKALNVELLGKGDAARSKPGRINFAGSTVDPTLGTVQLRAQFENPQLSILPGEYLRVRVSGGKMPGFTVPQTAVLQGAQGPFVWIANPENKAEQRFVQTGSWVGSGWRIHQGLSSGDTVILDNLLKLRPGQPLAPQLTGPPAERAGGDREEREISQSPQLAPSARTRGG